MIKGFDYENLLKIGFLNDNLEKNLKSYKSSWNVVITNDSDMNYVNEFVKNIK